MKVNATVQIPEGILTEYYDRQLEESGMSIAQYYLLINLHRTGPMNITHWAERVGLERSTMVRNVRTLEKNQYIELADGYGKGYKMSAYGEEGVFILNRSKQEVV